ncbi:zinc finger FYVE domain-containing protein 1-like [Acanthaster planci]|uniref:Zinc finger FYVE domain-containing protein 1-like n=1 Tax=Acanthaster planci TaxID=133434 RepID=A0A8B7Y0G1_ACAPL|nr:zinc finger FYVE domain-containing protein 1-like [Acanthaster planci]
MAAHFRTTDQHKNPGSKRICQERFSCNGSKAEFDCSDCGTRQCSECEKRLHASNPRFVDHSRARIQQPVLPASVQKCGMWCNPINPAEYSCIECKGVLCGECNRDFHRGKHSKHHRRPIVVAIKTNSDVSVEVERVRDTATSNIFSLSDSHSEQSRIFSGTLPEHETPVNSFTEEFQSAIEVCLDDIFPVLQKLESPPELNIRLAEGQSKEFKTFAMDELSSNEFRSLEEGLERVMKEKPKAVELDVARFGMSEEPSALSFNSGHFTPSAETSVLHSHESIKPAPKSRSTKQHAIASQPGKDTVNAKQESKSYSSSTTQQPLHSVGDECDQRKSDSSMSRSKPSTQQKAPILSNPSREPNLVRPVASVMGTSQNSISSSEGDGETESPRGSVSRRQIGTQGTGKDDAFSSIQLKTKEPVFRYKPGFLLVDENENLQVETATRFAEHLSCPPDTPVKVVSIFGNTGDGKSHSLNHTFFCGQDVFRTSPAQNSCTIGIWVAYDEATSVIVIDTEGLQGVSTNENQRTRLLLKVLAISDVVVYRTRADRLHRDLFQFLGDASKAYSRHFNRELKAASERGHLSGSLTSLGPAVIVFQETTHTLPLGSDQPAPGDSLGVSADAILRERFKEYGHSIDAFSCVQYIGTQTITPPTDFRSLRRAILAHVRNDSVRSPRPPTVIYNALKVLNDKFSGEIDATVPSTFPDEYFTCSDRCLSCDARCGRTMNHSKDNLPHQSESRCRYQHQFDNQVFICKNCYERGEEVLVVPKTSSSGDTSWLGLVKYAWSGYVLECPNCGIIYRSRQHWYGNLDPEQTAVRTEIRHVWPGGCTVLQGTHNAARRVVDGLSSVIETVSSVSARPTQMVTQWMTDQIAPAYWRPNAEITVCHMCEHPFGEGEKIHHCRSCGEGFCDDCSCHQMPVPERGWGDKPVRVCEQCYMKKCQDPGLAEVTPEDAAEQPVTVRRVGEVVQSTFSVLGNAMQYPLGFMVDAARPAYWVPDSEIIVCSCCQLEFTSKMRKHHCRACGKGVCGDCSEKRRPVPSRGWDEAVRVCNKCDKKQGPL